MASYDVFKERSQTIRQPATANLMIDSADRPFDLSGGYRYYPNTPFDFQIKKNQALLNGFFHRIGTTEVALEWDIPNIYSGLGTDYVTFDVSGAKVSSFLEQGFYTVKDILSYLPSAMNQSMEVNGISTGVYGLFSTSINDQDSLNYGLSNSLGKQFSFQEDPLINKLFVQNQASNSQTTKIFRNFIDLRPFRYIDFICDDLTYNQELKDADTTNQPKNVLNRWYFDWDNPPELDEFGYPIYQGYTPFRQRRLYNPPKQIRWNNEMPIGNLRFQVYGDNGSNLAYLSTNFRAWEYPNGTSNSYAPTNTTNWLMTLQASEN